MPSSPRPPAFAPSWLLVIACSLAACSNCGDDAGDERDPDAGRPIVEDACGDPEVRITEVELGLGVSVNEDEVGLRPLAISPIPGGGSRLAFMGTDGDVHVAELDEDDALVGAPAAFDANDFADVLADEDGGYLLLTRAATGGGTLGCGDPANLCGNPPAPAIACFDMVMTRFEGSTETWARTLTTASASLPPYSTGPTGPSVYMIWWYAHHGRLATDGTNVAAYYGAAISVSQGGCINIHQGDRMNVLAPNGDAVTGAGAFAWGCSHSGYEHLLWDDRSDEFVAVCKTDNMNRIAFAPAITTITPVDLAYANTSDHVRARDGGYWMLTSDARDGEPELADGLAEIHLLHFTDGVADIDRVLAGGSSVNARAPHLAEYGPDHLVATWETSASSGDLRNQADRTMHLQILRASDGVATGASRTVDVRGNRYQAMRSFPDGSVAYPAPGSSGTRVKVMRVLACDP